MVVDFKSFIKTNEKEYISMDSFLNPLRRILHMKLNLDSCTVKDQLSLCNHCFFLAYSSLQTV